MGKVFNQDHYDQDDIAKFQIIAWLEKQGYKAWVNPDQYGIDLLAERWGKKFQFEVEVKHNWKGEIFPFDNVHFSGRKRKFCSLDVETWFVMLNHERTHALLIDGEHFMNSSRIVMKNTKYSQNEAFVEIDIGWGIFRNLLEEGK